jgi:hypothetical protein
MAMQYRLKDILQSRALPGDLVRVPSDGHDSYFGNAIVVKQNSGSGSDHANCHSEQLSLSAKFG